MYLCVVAVAFFVLTCSIHPFTALKMQCFKDPQSGAQPQPTRNTGSDAGTLVQGHSSSLCFSVLSQWEFNNAILSGVFRLYH